jgi:melibiose permease/lactose/raffinose/galactose permease
MGKKGAGADRNVYMFGIGTIGRDMVYSIISMFLLFYLTDVLKVETGALWWISGITFACRVFDAFNDPFMGVVVDNTHSRFGKFKPWIAFGAFTSGIVTILIFMDFGLSGTAYVVVFGILYLLWGMTYTSNDIAYWSMLPSLSVDQQKRERIGSIARICASVGMFFVVAGIMPITKALGGGEDTQKGYFLFALIIVAIMWIGQGVTLFGVREPKVVNDRIQNKTTLKEMVKVIFMNDQLLITAVCMSLFMIGYMTTTSFGQYFFKYAYGNEDMYPIFALILGVSQIAALAVFPLFGKRFERKTTFTAAVVLITLGYIIFFFAPGGTMLFIGIAGVLIFVGEAAVQLLMLMFLSDTVDFGHLKFGKRNDSGSFAIQPFINKLGGAVGNGVVSVVIILSGIKAAETGADVTSGGLLMMKIAMMLLPLALILVSFAVYMKKYKIDKKTHADIVEKLVELGELNSKS